MTKFYLLAALLSFPPKGFGQVVVASWYDKPGLTASGSRYDPRKLTAAHKTLPFGTIVSLKKGDRKVDVEITDRGPFVKGRHFDLSKAAAKRLDIKGVEKIELTKVRRGKNGNDRRGTARSSASSKTLHSASRRAAKNSRRTSDELHSEFSKRTGRR